MQAVGAGIIGRGDVNDGDEFKVLSVNRIPVLQLRLAQIQLYPHRTTAVLIIVHNSRSLVVSWDDHTFKWFGMTRTKDYLAHDTLIVAVFVP